MESIQTRLDRVLEHVGELKAKAEQIVLSREDLKELTGEEDAAGGDYQGVAVQRGEIGQSSYVATTGGPSGEVNFGV